MPFWLETSAETKMILGLVLIGLGIYAIVRQQDVRLVLLVTALGLGVVAGDVNEVVRKFLETFADERFVVPICTAMGFAYVLRHTECDQHLVHLVVRPLTKVRFLLVPGTVLVGFLVNMPIISQTSTAITIGPVVIPILRAARFSPATIGAAILLGSSIGGELLNPGAPEFRTTMTMSQEAAKKRNIDSERFDNERCQRRILPLNLLCLAAATGVFWLMSWREGKIATQPAADHEAAFRINPLKAMVPLVPLVLLYLVSPPLQIFQVPEWWLEEFPDRAPKGRFGSRLIGTAMLVGTALAAVAGWRKGPKATGAFFEGAGYGFTHIISLIVAASCFGKGIELIGLAKMLGQLIEGSPNLLLPAAGAMALGFAALSGSGMAATQSLFGFFAGPSLDVGIDPTHTGAVVSLAAAAGRTMSPVAAVTLMTATMTEVPPLLLARRVALPLLVGIFVAVVVGMLAAPAP